MTRQEQLYAAAIEKKGLHIKVKDFIKGAEWADANPLPASQILMNNDQLRREIKQLQSDRKILVEALKEITNHHGFTTDTPGEAIALASYILADKTLAKIDAIKKGE